MRAYMANVAFTKGSTSHRQTFKILDIPSSWHCLPYLSSDWYAWCAKHAYQVMLKFHGRLITPFLVCSSEHSDLSFVYRFMNLIYGLGTLTTFFLMIFRGVINKFANSCFSVYVPFYFHMVFRKKYKLHITWLPNIQAAESINYVLSPKH